MLASVCHEEFKNAYLRSCPISWFLSGGLAHSEMAWALVNIMLISTFYLNAPKLKTSQRGSKCAVKMAYLDPVNSIRSQGTNLPKWATCSLREIKISGE